VIAPADRRGRRRASCAGPARHRARV